MPLWCPPPLPEKNPSSSLPVKKKENILPNTCQKKRKRSPDGDEANILEITFLASTENVINWGWQLLYYGMAHLINVPSLSYSMGLNHELLCLSCVTNFSSQVCRSIHVIMIFQGVETKKIRYSNRTEHLLETDFMGDLCHMVLLESLEIQLCAQT